MVRELSRTTALDEMTAKSMAGQDQMRTVLKSVAMSEPFLHKNTRDPAKADAKQNNAPLRKKDSPRHDQ